MSGLAFLCMSDLAFLCTSGLHSAYCIVTVRLSGSDAQLTPAIDNRLPALQDFIQKI